jgi:hypothetical protein
MHTSLIVDNDDGTETIISHSDSTKEFAQFYFNGFLVVGLSISNSAGGRCTIFNFLDIEFATDFATIFRNKKRSPQIIQNGSQIIVMTDIKNSMSFIPAKNIKLRGYTVGAVH